MILIAALLLFVTELSSSLDACSWGFENGENRQMSFERFDDSYDLLICLKRLRLTHKMKFHGHQILLNDDGDRMLLYEDQWTPLVELEPVLSLSAEDFKRHYTYTCRGIVAPSNSEAIHLFQQRSPRGEFSVEIVSRLMSPPHAWIRLISDEGEVYSAGFFPDRELQGWLEMVTALYPSRGSHRPSQYHSCDSDPN